MLVIYFSIEYKQSFTVSSTLPTYCLLIGVVGSLSNKKLSPDLVEGSSYDILTPGSFSVL
jgi:hypothetical protein